MKSRYLELINMDFKITVLEILEDVLRLQGEHRKQKKIKQYVTEAKSWFLRLEAKKKKDRSDPKNKVNKDPNVHKEREFFSYQSCLFTNITHHWAHLHPD